MTTRTPAPVRSGACQLTLDGVVVRYGPRVVLDGLDLLVGAGERLALVGENGSGKSTLLRVLAGELAPDVGHLHRSGSALLLPQEVDLNSFHTVGDLLVSATSAADALQRQRAELEQQMAGDTSPAVLESYAAVLETIERTDAWDVGRRLDVTLTALGLAGIEPPRALETLSGGERHRLALAALLVQRPDVLLLDEPTTHLDDDAVSFLQGHAAGWPGVVVLASHDRALVDAVCTGVLDLDPGGGQGPTRYGGGYSDYLVAKAADRQRWEQAYAQWQEEHDRLTASANGRNVRVGHDNRAPRDNDKHAPHFFGQRVDGTVARRVRDAQHRLDHLEPVAEPTPPLRFSARIGANRLGDGVLLQARDIDVPGRVRLRALDVAHDTRLLVTGPNGSGKSSLLAVLAGRLEPGAGRVLRARGVRVGLLLQETRWPDPTLNVVSAFSLGREGDVDEQVSALLDAGVLHPRELRTPVGQLSTGQQRRVALARLVADAPDVLLLDEPTDHLSLTLVEELEQALLSRGGPLVVVSHDRWLRRRWSGETMSMRR